MPDSLTPALANQCRAAFAQCSEFSSHKLLRSVFVTESLFPFQLGVPAAGSDAERIDLCIDYLLSKRLKDGPPALPVFVAALRDKYATGDAIRDELQALYDDLLTELQPKPIARDPRFEQNLYRLLLSLDFTEPIKKARDVIQKRPIGAFLVSGQPECAQEVLAYRLMRLCHKADTAKVIRINAGLGGIGRSQRALWHELLKSLDLATDGAGGPAMPPDKIAEKVFEWWQDKDVIFVFHTVDYMPPALLSAWICDFWQPIVKAAEKRLNGAARATRLLLFLVDYSGDVPAWSIPWAQAGDHPSYPNYPLPLPAARCFTEKEIDDWLNFALVDLPLDAQVTAQNLLAETDNGLPYLVFQRLCKIYGLSWEGVLAKWLQ